MPQWRQLLFGEWSLSRNVWLIQSVLGVGILAVRLRALDIAPGSTFLTIVIGPIGSALVLWGASRTCLRDRSVGLAHPWVVLAVWFLAACFRGYAATGAPITGLDALTLTGNIVFSLLWTAIFTYIFASSHFYRERSKQMDSLIIAAALYDQHKAELLQIERRRLLHIVQDELLPSLVTLRDDIARLATDGDRTLWLSLADRVGGLLIDRVRSVSRAGELTRAPTEDVVGRRALAAPRTRNLISDAKTANMSVTLALILFTACGLLLLVPRVGMVGYVFLACVAAAALPLLLVGRLVMSMVPAGWLRAALLPLFYLFIGLIIGEITQWFPGSAEVHSTIALRAVVAIFAMVTGLGASLVRQHQSRWDALFGSQEMALENFEATKVDLEREHLQIQRQMSHLLHGPVQGNLAALTLALRVHAAAEHEEFSAGQREVIMRSTALIDESLRTLREILDEPERGTVDVGARLVELTRAWRGLMTITLDMPAEVLSVSRADPGLLQDALDAVEEGITNASRHGDARNLEIKIRLLVTGEVEVVLLNDGRPVSGAVSAGFGLKAIDAAGGRWSLVEVEGGRTCFTAVLPARSPAGG